MSEVAGADPLGHVARRPCAAAREALWRLISDPRAWPSWNASASRLELDGPFRTGTTGRLTTRDGQELPFELTSVTHGTGYTSTTRIASTVSLESTLRLIEDTGRRELLVEQASRLTGPAAEHFAPSFGAALTGGVEQTVDQLAAINS